MSSDVEPMRRPDGINSITKSKAYGKRRRVQSESSNEDSNGESQAEAGQSTISARGGASKRIKTGTKGTTSNKKRMRQAPIVVKSEREDEPEQGLRDSVQRINGAHRLEMPEGLSITSSIGNIQPRGASITPFDDDDVSALGVEPRGVASRDDLMMLTEDEAQFTDYDPMFGLTDNCRPLTAAESAKMSLWRANRLAEKEMRKEMRKSAQPILNRLEDKLNRGLSKQESDCCFMYYHHPELEHTWDRLQADQDAKPKIPPMAPQPKGLKLKLLPFQEESLAWFQAQEASHWKGGILADEMGLGKTIQTLSLILDDGQKPNLIVAPTVAVMQWKNEIEAHTVGLKALVWHGANRKSDQEKIKSFDVVLTTYAVLESVFRRQEKGFRRKGLDIKEPSPLHSIVWNRIVLDEAHNIKDRQTNTAKAAFELQAAKHWCLTGTPLQNRVGELYSLVRFIGGDPYSFYFCKQCDCKSLHWNFPDKRACASCGHAPSVHACFWNAEILGPIARHGIDGQESHPDEGRRRGRDPFGQQSGSFAFSKLKMLMDAIMLRRTKLERADDLGLPPRFITVRRDFFSDEEKELYASLYREVKRTFTTYENAGTVLNNYSNIFTLILRMRQMACHPDLVLRSESGPHANTLQESTVCRICADIAEDPIKSRCHHIFCRECARQYLNTSIDDSPACPQCHAVLTIDIFAEAVEPDEHLSKRRQGILARLNMANWRSSTKIEALVEELTKLRREDSTTKSIVFSQFVNFLDLIQWRLQRAGFSTCRLEGTMTPAARDATIKHFMSTVSCGVFLVSLKAGGVALNLTEASRVFIMDPWWHESSELQAMDRIHRLGQHRPVVCYKMLIEDSIESRIVMLQEKKSAMVSAALTADKAAMNRLTVNDLEFLFRNH